MCYLPTTKEILSQQNILFELRLITSLAQKPTGFSNTPKPVDPFAPPFEDGIFISPITSTHSLVFNKFCICDEHVIAFPNEFERQD